MKPEGDLNIDLFQPKFSTQQDFFIECSPEETFEFLLADVLY